MTALDPKRQAGQFTNIQQHNSVPDIQSYMYAPVVTNQKDTTARVCHVLLQSIRRDDYSGFSRINPVAGVLANLSHLLHYLSILNAFPRLGWKYYQSFPR